MSKECKLRCKYCRARHRERFMLQFPDKDVCNDCVSEYRKIFHGAKNRAERRKETHNPLFEAFKRGWEHEEKEMGLPPMEIPEAIKIYYQALFNIQNEKRQDESS